MFLFEALEITDLTHKEVQAELNKHGASFNDFVKACGNKEVYTGEDVLFYLGY